MEAPQSPIDIKIIMGFQQECQNLMNIDIDFIDNIQQVEEYLTLKNLSKQYGEGCAILFDFYVEEGKIQQALKYFNNKSQAKSPLQILFKKKPTESSQICKFQIFSFQNYVRLLYKFDAQQNQQSFIPINQILQDFQTGGTKMQSHINIDLKGSIIHTKNNRTTVLVDYSKFHFVSNAFCSQNFFNTISTFTQIQNNCHYYINNPFFELVKKSKVAQLYLKMNSFRKLSKYYNKVSNQPKQHEQKQFNYINQGIFRKQAEAALIYRNQYLIKIVGQYQSQNVFIRLVKVYAKFFEKLLNVNFYKEE